MNKHRFLFVALFLGSFSSIRAEGQSMQHEHVVVVLLQAIPGTEDTLKQELLEVKRLSEQEPACISYRVHQDTTNPTQFALYEMWTTKEDHARQFEKPYILAFASKLKDLLAAPYQAVMAKNID